MVTRIETIRPGLTGRVVKTGEVRVGDRIYVTRSGVANDVRTVTEVIKQHRCPAVYRFDRGPDLDERQLRRRDGTVLLLDAGAEVGPLPEEVALGSRLDQWIGRGGARGVEHTPHQYEMSAQMLTRMHQDTGREVYRCYAIDPRSLLIERLPDGIFDADDPRPQLLIWSRMWLLDAVAHQMIAEATGRASADAWIKSQHSLMLASRDIPYDLPVEADPTLVMVMPAAP